MYSGDTGAIDVEFYAQSLQSFNNIKNIIYADEDISLNLSMETEITDSGLYTGRVSFTDRNFSPLVIGQTEEKSK